MPLFEFYCKQCDKVEEILVRNANESVECPTCKSHDLQKQLSVIATPSIASTSSRCETSSTNCNRPQCAGGGCMFGN